MTNDFGGDFKEVDATIEILCPLLVAKISIEHIHNDNQNQ